MSWGFLCDDGWFALVYHLSQQITEYAVGNPAVQEVMAAQGKEKFGTLRFYVRGEDAHIRRLIDTAEAQSVATCERDGRPGRLRKHPGLYHKTLCDDCARAS